MEPITEFRTIDASGPEPSDRAASGVIAGTGGALELGRVDTTDEAQDIPVRVLWWRVSDMRGCAEITNIRARLTGTDTLAGDNAWHMDITDSWTPGKTPVQVATGSPGIAPSDTPGAALERAGGGPIEGTSHDQTSQYIYIAGRIAVNETTGDKTGIVLEVTYDYR